MKKTIALLLIMATLLSGLTMALSSCGDDSTDPGADIHLFLSSRIYDLDPSLAVVDDDAAQILSLLYEPLFTLKEDGSVSGALAKSYDIDKKNGTMTITLRNTYWSNANAVTAYDVVYAWKRILDPSTENPAAALLYDIQNAVAVKQGSFENGTTATIDDLGVEVISNKKMVITFRDDLEYIDYNEFLRNLSSIALAPVPEDTVSNYQNADNWSKRMATITTNGPFTLKALDYQSGEFALQRNNYYRRSKNSETALTEYVTPQFLSTIWQTSDMSIEDYETYLTENVILHFADEEDNKGLKNSFYYIGEIPLALRNAETYADKVKVKDLLSVSSCVLNTAQNGNPVLANAKVRLALSTIIDRQSLATQLVYAKPATGIITPGVYEPGKKTDFRHDSTALLATSANQQKAEQLLAEGLSELKLTKNDLGTLWVVYSGESVNDAYTAKYLKGVWESLGFKVKLDAVYGNKRQVNEDIQVFDSVLQEYFNSDWTDCRGNTFQENEDAAPRQADVLLVDYQMLATNALATLATFSSDLSGNGFNISDTTAGDKIYSYAPIPHVSGYSSEAYDALIDAAYAAKDAATRAEALHNAEKMLLDAMPVIPLVFNQDYYLISDTLTKVKTNAYGMPVFTKAYQKGYLDLKLNDEDAE